MQCKLTPKEMAAELPSLLVLTNIYLPTNSTRPLLSCDAALSISASYCSIFYKRTERSFFKAGEILHQNQRWFIGVKLHLFLQYVSKFNLYRHL